MAFTPQFGTGFEMGDPYIENIADNYASSEMDRVYTRSGTKHTGSYAISMEGYEGPTLGWDVSGSPTEIYVGCWFYGDSNYYGLINVNTDGDDFIIRCTSSGGNIRVDAFHAGASVANGTILSPLNTWFNVQARISLDNATGVFQIKIDGVLDVDYSGDTISGGATEFTEVEIGVRSVSTSNEFYFDDFVFGTGGWPGDIRFDALFPNADTATIDFTGSDGNQVDNHDLVDEVPPSDADYVESTTNGDQDKYDLDDWDETDKEPVFTVAWARASKDEADAHQLKLILDDGTEDVGSGQDIGTDAGYIYRVDATPPSGGSWTNALLDALEVGIESVIV